ncbi:hypothetical protein JKP88DRAFT_283786 [Tribonema minus]|uniref:Uncharacterized protein n=1 Tax=Tribonema minus TaxID=303371 RepID=A0A835YHJ2_9STRA|nr:hypothetical protein JKP88DRAFT_283786 [Tribonema minus]
MSMPPLGQDTVPPTKKLKQVTEEGSAQQASSPLIDYRGNAELDPDRPGQNPVGKQPATVFVSGEESDVEKGFLGRMRAIESRLALLEADHRALGAQCGQHRPPPTACDYFKVMGTQDPGVAALCGTAADMTGQQCLDASDALIERRMDEDSYVITSLPELDAAVADHVHMASKPEVQARCGHACWIILHYGAPAASMVLVLRTQRSLALLQQ